VESPPKVQLRRSANESTNQPIADAEQHHSSEPFDLEPPPTLHPEPNEENRNGNNGHVLLEDEASTSQLHSSSSTKTLPPTHSPLHNIKLLFLRRRKNTDRFRNQFNLTILSLREIHMHRSNYSSTKPRQGIGLQRPSTRLRFLLQRKYPGQPLHHSSSLRSQDLQPKRGQHISSGDKMEV